MAQTQGRTPLVTASNDVMAALAAMGPVTEETSLAVLERLIGAGRGLHEALDAVAQDEGLWSGLRENAGTRLEEWGEQMAVVTAGRHALLLELLGYEEPPPSSLLADELADALELVRAQAGGPEDRSEQLDRAREALREFNARLGSLLEDHGLIEQPRKLGKLRRMLARGAKVARFFVPVAIAYAASGIGHVHGVPVPPEVIAGVLEGLLDAIGPLVRKLLPKSETADAGVAAVLDSAGPLVRARTLAEAIRAELLRMPLDASHGGLIEQRLRPALDALDREVQRGDIDSPSYLQARAHFEAALSLLAEQPNEEQLAEAREVWSEVTGALAGARELDAAELVAAARARELERRALDEQRASARQRELTAEKQAKLKEIAKGKPKLTSG